MRIANIIEEGKIGGPQLRMVRVAVALRERVDTLIVMPTENNHGFRALCEQNQIPVRSVAITRITKEVLPAVRYVAFSLFEVVFLARMFRRQKIDLVHVSGGSWQVKGVIAARLAGIPSVWHLNDTLMPRWVRAIFQTLSPLATGYIFASHRTQEYYGPLISNRFSDVISSTVEVDRFNCSDIVSGDEDVIAQLNGSLVIGTAGNVNPVKGIDTLINSLPAMRLRVPNVRLVVVGAIHANQAAYHRRLVALAESLGVADIIDWVGWRSDVRPILKRMDVYVCSSVAESSPASVWEAMAMARPVVSTKVGDVPNHLVDGESGYLVDVGDHQAMAERVADLLLDPEKRVRFGIAATAAAQVFSPTEVARKTENFYKKILELSHD